MSIAGLFFAICAVCMFLAGISAMKNDFPEDGRRTTITGLHWCYAGAVSAVIGFIILTA